MLELIALLLGVLVNLVGFHFYPDLFQTLFHLWLAYVAIKVGVRLLYINGLVYKDGKVAKLED